jgi:hypothetical protein
LLAAAGSGAGGGSEAGGGKLVATLSSSDFRPLGFMFFMSIVEPFFVTEMHDSELQLRGASMRIFWPSILNEKPSPACAAEDAINSAAAAAKWNVFFMGGSIAAGWGPNGSQPSGGK